MPALWLLLFTFFFDCQGKVLFSRSLKAQEPREEESKSLQLEIETQVNFEKTNKPETDARQRTSSAKKQTW